MKIIFQRGFGPPQMMERTTGIHVHPYGKIKKREQNSRIRLVIFPTFDGIWSMLTKVKLSQFPFAGPEAIDISNHKLEIKIMKLTPNVFSTLILYGLYIYLYCILSISAGLKLDTRNQENFALFFRCSFDIDDHNDIVTQASFMLSSSVKWQTSSHKCRRTQTNSMNNWTIYEVSMASIKFPIMSENDWKIIFVQHGLLRKGPTRRRFDLPKFWPCTPLSQAVYIGIL